MGGTDSVSLDYYRQPHVLPPSSFYAFISGCRGPEGTCFEGGVFPARLVFPPDYPLSPPKMKFTCEIFHPNSKFFGRYPPYKLVAHFLMMMFAGVWTVLLQSLPMAVFVYRYCMLLAMIPWATSPRLSAGAQCRVSRRFCSVWSPCWPVTFLHAYTLQL